jgi:hypothetical protein
VRLKVNSNSMKMKMKMKMNRPAAREIVSSKSDGSGQAWRRHLGATLLNRFLAKIRKSEVVSLSSVKSYPKCVDGVGALKQFWISSSCLLVMMILSHGARAVGVDDSSTNRLGSVVIARPSRIGDVPGSISGPACLSLPTRAAALVRAFRSLDDSERCHIHQARQ